MAVFTKSILLSIYLSIYIRVVRCSFSDLYSLKSSSVPDKVYITSFYNILWDCLDSDKDMSSCLKSQVLFLLDNSLKTDVAPVLKEPTLKQVIDEEFRDIVSQEDDDDDDDDAEKVKDKDEDSSSYDSDDERKRSLDIFNDTNGLVRTAIQSIAKRYFGFDTNVFEGRKRYKRLGQSMMMAIMTAAFILGSLSYKFISLLAGKALLVGKIALVLAIIANLRKSSHHSYPIDYDKRARHFSPKINLPEVDVVEPELPNEFHDPYRSLSTKIKN